jgi:aspartate racemase
MKTIGIVGGLSPESTILYYRTIVNEYRKRYGNENYPQIIIYSVTFGKLTQLMRENRLEEVVAELLEAVKSLHAAGADLALISANTPHMFFDKIASQSPIPMISIIDSLAEVLRKDNVRKVGLLGTKYTLTRSFYVEGLRRHGIEAIIPAPEDVEMIDRIIFKELTWGVVKEESQKLLENIVRKLINKGADGIALACTELPLLLKGSIEGVKLYDTAEIHSIKALEFAMSDEGTYINRY